MTIPVFDSSAALHDVRYEIRGQLARRAHELEKMGYEIVHLNIGNPGRFGFRTPETMRLAMIENLAQSEAYSHQKGIFPAREAVVMQQQSRGVSGVTAEEVFIGNGVSELIDLTLRAMLNRDDEILVPSPDYPLWTAAVTLNGGRAVHYPCLPENGFLPDPDALRAYDLSFDDVVEVQIVALRAMVQNTPVTGRFKLILPTGTTAETYAKVNEALGGNAQYDAPPPPADAKPKAKSAAKPADEGDAPAEPDPLLLGDPTELEQRAAEAAAQPTGPLPVIEVKQIRIRGYRAEVDIIRPSDLADPASPRALYTIHEKWAPFDGWIFQRAQLWRIPVEDALERSRVRTDREGPADPRSEP